MHLKCLKIIDLANEFQGCIFKIKIAIFKYRVMRITRQNRKLKNYVFHYLFKYFCIFVDDLLNSTEKKEIVLRWAYEIYSTFIR